MNQEYIEKLVFKDHYLDMAFLRYQEFKKTNTYDEAYKMEILSELNHYLQHLEIKTEKIVEIIQKIRDSNPQEGSFVHWSNTSDLLDYTNAQPEEVASLLNELYKDNDSSIQDKIETFRNHAKQSNANIKLGAPLFGYLLAAYDYKTFPLYKEEVYKDIKKILGIQTKLGSVSKNYQDYYDICLTVSKYLNQQGHTVNMLDVQDFFFCLTRYDQPKVEAAVDYICSVAKELATFQENDQVFLDAIKQLDQEHLEKRKEAYRNSEKVNKIRYYILKQIVQGNDLELKDIENIKEEVKQENEKNVLRSWNNFRIFFSIYYDYIKDKVKHQLGTIHQAIRDLEAITDLHLQEGRVLNGFDWNQNFGNSESWLAVYPADKESHKEAAQLFLLVDENNVKYGLVYGTEHPKRGEENIDSLQNPKQFTYQKLKDKMTEVLPQFIKDNQTGFENSPINALSDTFSGIFDTAEEAKWAFDYIHQTLIKLGITEAGDPRVAVTFPAGKRFHIDFCNWLILGFRGSARGESQVQISLLEDKIKNTSYDRQLFTTKEGELPVALVQIPFKEFQSSKHLQDVFEDTLEFINQRFQGYTRSPYRKFNIEELEEAVFDPDKRNKIFTEPRTYIPTEEDDTNYFWLTANPSIWSVDEIKDGGAVNYTAYNEKGNKRRIFGAFENANPGDKILFYESTPRKEIVAQGEVVEGMHLVEEEGFAELAEGVSFRYVEDITPISWEVIAEVEELQDSSPIKNGAQGSLFELTKIEFETILSLEQPVATENEVDIPTIDFNQEIDIESLYFEEKNSLLRQVKTALVNGKHIILTGPPGTGKSKLAKEICQSLDAEFKMATATSDWSTYETIGGYRPKSDGTLSFNPGLFLDCFKDAHTNRPINKWLIIDEMNRADIDKAFGSLFSALTGDAITLNFQSESGQSLLLRPQVAEEKVIPNDYEYIIPNDWRLIGTMNTLDKASLYEMSYAFMRRFAFIPVGVPRKIDETLIQEFLEKWKIEDYAFAEELAFIWRQINQYRPIGPAIVEDLAKYTAVDADFTSAIILYVLPQFEGLMDNEILEFIERVSQSPVVEKERLLVFAQDFFHLKG
ncbi:AAA family ATPase [Oceanobacillus halophilus]|uniref:EVE domain-containing protein n=1 Tax=Oceanobacillus halophilus TaxID=930130 RepID=A0A494ZT60_9BACI|nr:AAA family ATPase [Oceanobacillus halophilus]RKQ29333.1 EVE domain-containing protein [Oceanobacillus halophilus]